MNNSLIVKESPLDFQTTYTQVKSKIENNPNLKLIFELDHSENASKKDLSLRPTKLLIFGNPNLGTPLMNVAPTLAIDLPQKIMIYEEAGKVFITYNNPEYLKERHNIEGKDELLNKISNALNKLTTVE
ncbi:DUF302 domain-containing protein [Tenacibaculum jejuense]|nr:DUF302 domain-containing protein [Tenacibaculum jejuense]